MSFIGLDIGTSGVRCVAIDGDGRTISAAETSIALHLGDGDSAEVDAWSVWSAAEDTMRSVATSPDVRRDPAEACSFSVQGEAVVPINAQSEPLARVPVSFDMRATSATAQLAEQVGSDRLRQITGQPVHPMFSIGKMIVAHRQREASRIHGWRCFGDFIAERLGAEPAMDTTVAARTMAFDVDGRHWSGEILDAAGIDETLLPTVVDPTSSVGRMSLRSADDLGFTSRPLIVAGAHDQACAFWGAGCVDSGEVAASLGSSECVTTATAERVNAASVSGVASYPAGSTWLMLAGIPTGGLALDWLRNLVGGDTQISYEELLGATTSKPSGLLVFPYLAGGAAIDNDPAATGGIIGLTLRTGRADIARGLLEASGYEIRRVVDWLARNGVAHVTSLRVVGGGASEAALEVRANSSGLILRYVTRHAAARGAALLAAAGSGAGTLRDVVRHMDAGGSRQHLPVERHREFYAEQRRAYTAHVKALSAVRGKTQLDATT